MFRAGWSNKDMAKRVSLTFLGTSAGGGPTPSRSCTSNALSIDNSIWRESRIARIL